MSADPPMPAHKRFGAIELRLHERQLRVGGRPVALGSRAFDLLAALVMRRDRVVPKDELIELVWPGMVVEENNLQVQVSALRKALGPQAIATVPGRGYRFVVAAETETPVPFVRGHDVPAEAPVDAMRHRSGARPSRLLVVDDNRLNRLLLCRSLELMGHEVDTVVNGREALERMRRDPVDLILLDLQMPELDGFALLELRADDPVLREIPVIVTSALEGEAHVARCIELGADDYLYKPPNPVLLQARVDSSLARKHLRDRERALLARLMPGSGGLDERSALVGRRIEATVLSVQLDDVGALAETPTRTLELLGDWCTLMLDVIEGHGGLVTQLAGDTIVAVFGATGAGPAARAPWSATQAARDMLELIGQFDRERAKTGRTSIGTRIGIASGPTLVGEAGTKRRAMYVGVGPTARRAARLQALAAEAKATVLLDHATHGALAGLVAMETLCTLVLPGTDVPVAVYALSLRS